MDQRRRRAAVARIMDAEPMPVGSPAVLTAAAYSVGASALVSVDKAFSEVPDIRHVIPDADGVRQLFDGE